MFNKLVVVSIIIFVLTGCGKKVTGDMLIGEWDCQYTLYQDPSLDNETQAKRSQGDSPSSPYKMIYLKDDVYYKAIKNNDRPFTIMDNVFTDNDGSYQVFSAPEQMIGRGQYIFVSDDSYKLSEINFVGNIEIEKESLCTRVK